MERRRFYITMGELKRYRVTLKCLEGEISAKDASFLLGLGYRQFLRIKKEVKERGIEGVIRKTGSGKPSTPGSIRKEIERLYTGVYGNRFNILHFKEKLQEFHNIELSYETIREILIKANLHRPKQKKRKHRKRRQRMPMAGMLIQMDSSYHKWIEEINEKWHLTYMIDDATNEVLYARFYPKDTTFSNMEVIRKAIETKGVFMALYVDKASHFKTTRYGGLHYNVSIEQEETQIDEALGELGITLITANSPQAKGRVERLFGFFQDRLINEMWLKKIKDYSEANKFLLEEFLPWYNKKYKREAKEVYRKLQERENPDLIFTKRYTRRVNKDNTISIFGTIIQIPPTKRALSLMRSPVEVRLSSSNKMWILYKGEVIHESILPETNKMLKKEERIENLLKERRYAKM